MHKRTQILEKIEKSPFDGIGIRAMLRTWILWVRIPWGAPYKNTSVRGLISLYCDVATAVCSYMVSFAGMVKLVDTRDLKSLA